MIDSSLSSVPRAAGSRAQLCSGAQIDRSLYGDEEVAVENIVVKVIERRGRLKFAGRDPSVSIGPLPARG